MRVGTVVRLHSLVARPALNDRRGTVAKAFDAATGRCGVRVDGESTMMALRPANLVDVADEAIQAVLTDADLLRSILEHVPRWVRAGIVSGVSTTLRQSVWAHPDLYRSVVVLAATDRISRGIAPLRHVAMRDAPHRDAKTYSARLFVEEGALPLLPAQVAMIPDTGWVQSLFVEPGGNSAWEDIPKEAVINKQLASVLSREWPSVETLLVAGIGSSCWHESANGEVAQRTKANQCREWVRRHVRRSVLHLHLDGDVFVELANRERVYMLDTADSAGLISMQFDSGIRYEAGDYQERGLRAVVTAWPAEARDKVRHLDLNCWPREDEVSDADNIVYAIHHLPNLTRLKCMLGGPEEEDFEALARAAASGKLESLYLNIDSSEGLPITALDAFESVRTLEELVVVCDSCSWVHPSAGPCSEELVTRTLYSKLVRPSKERRNGFALLVCNQESPTDLGILDPLFRVLLPTTKEEWHLEANAHGVETLPFVREMRRRRHAASLRMELPGTVYDAAFEGNEAAVVAWLDGGGGIDARLVEDDDVQGTLLMCAACFAGGSRLSLVELLLSRGASVDLQNIIGWTALMGAAFEGSIEVVRRLLRAGAALEVQNKNGNTALSIARQRGHKEIVNLLCDSGAGAMHPPGDPRSSVDECRSAMMEILRRFPEHCAVVRQRSVEEND